MQMNDNQQPANPADGPVRRIIELGENPTPIAQVDPAVHEMLRKMVDAIFSPEQRRRLPRIAVMICDASGDADDKYPTVNNFYALIEPDLRSEPVNAA